MSRRVCVYCASSRQADASFPEAARRLGGLLARGGATVVCGGGAVGSMGALAEGVLAESGTVVGVVPRFMRDLEWSHPRLSELVLVETMHERKRAMLEGAAAAVALPGGCGTFEELLEAMAWKRLGLWSGPIVILNQGGFYDPLLALLERAIRERFMDARHAVMWQAVSRPEDVLPAIEGAPRWFDNARDFAVP
jgi:uncharacterized protein (TIGR00730 family)